LRTSKAKRPPLVSCDKLVSAAGLVWDVTVRFGQPEYIDERQKPLLGMNQTILRAGQSISRGNQIFDRLVHSVPVACGGMRGSE